MGFYLRKRIHIAPGVRLNVGLKQASMTLGKGVRVNVGTRGITPGATIGGGCGYRGRTRRPGKGGGGPVAMPVTRRMERWLKPWFCLTALGLLGGLAGSIATHQNGEEALSRLLSQGAALSIVFGGVLMILLVAVFGIETLARDFHNQMRKIWWGFVLFVVFPAVLVGVGAWHEAGWLLPEAWR